MPLPGVVLGRRIGPFPHRLDEALLRAFAQATAEPLAQVRSGRTIAPMAIVSQVWEAQQQGRAALVPPELQAAATGGLHGEHDVVIHRPIVPGESLSTWVEGSGARPAGPNSLVTLRYSTFDARDDLVVEQWWTTVWLGVTCDASGDFGPEHSFPDAARDHPLGEWQVEVDAEMARGYAQVSNDWSPHHFDRAAARRSGAEDVFLHGLCTMALCGQGVIVVAADRDPDRLRRIAVRFSQPVLLGETLEVKLYDAGPDGCAFEGTVGGRTVITNGRAELR